MRVKKCNDDLANVEFGIFKKVSSSAVNGKRRRWRCSLENDRDRDFPDIIADDASVAVKNNGMAPKIKAILLFTQTRKLRQREMLSSEFIVLIMPHVLVF